MKSSDSNEIAVEGSTSGDYYKTTMTTEEATRATASFNGGKMAHIFQFDVSTGLYESSVTSQAAEEALRYGRLFYKIDGSNGMIMREVDGGGGGGKITAYQRLDTKGRPLPDGCVRLPPGLNADTYEGHSYCYQPITMEIEGKKAKKRNRAMLDLVEKHREEIIAFMENQNAVSIEWVGNKFNKTAGVPHDVAIALHTQQICAEQIERSFEGMQSFLLDEIDPPVEGIVIEYQGTFWKVRADCFDKKCRFKKNPKMARPPIFLS